MDEIENDTVRTSCPDDVGETENPCLQPEGSDPAADESFASLLAGTVERNGHAWPVVFWRWKRCIFSVNDRTGGKGNFLHACDSHGFKDVVGCHRPLFEVGIGDACAKADIRVGSEMEDTINVHGHGLVNVLWMTYIALDQGHMTCINVVLDEGNIAAGEVIDDHDCVTLATKRSMRCDPMKPAPPVTKARMD